MKKIILWMLIFTGFIYALMGLHNSSEQEIIKKETNVRFYKSKTNITHKMFKL